ncbi:MAG: heparin lyase I family protein [Bacteroidota bacterium]
MKRISILSISLITLFACNSERLFEGPNAFQDGFEGASSLEDLLLPEDILWSFTQQTLAENTITLDSNRAYSGNQALRFEARASGEGSVSKCSLAKQNMAFWAGETVRVSARYFLAGTQSAEWLFLMDLEERTSIGAGPGMRLALVNNQLRMEYKFPEPDVVQTAGQEIDLPRNQWVELVWEVTLSQQDEGSVRLWQDDQLILDQSSLTTLPTDILYFQQGTKGMYSSIEIGITANSQDNDLTLWVDDFRIEVVE